MNHISFKHIDLVKRNLFLPFLNKCKLNKQHENYSSSLIQTSKKYMHSKSIWYIDHTEREQKDKYTKCYFSTIIKTNNNNNNNNNNNQGFSAKTKKNLSVSGHNRGKLFVGIKKDFTSFIMNILIIGVFLYSVYTLAPKETVSQRRKRIIRERLMREYQITEEDLDLIEEFEDTMGKMK